MLCFLDSLATLGYSIWLRIRYRYGMFKQEIDLYQVEVPMHGLKKYYPFELRRPEYAKEVHSRGQVRVEYDQAPARTNLSMKDISSKGNPIR